MKASKMNFMYLVMALTVLLLAGVRPVAAQNPTPDERVAAVKASLAQSAEVLKGYEWIETTVVSYKGEEKSTDREPAAITGQTGSCKKLSSQLLRQRRRADCVEKPRQVRPTT